jgi:isocitrate dehydrogenase
MAQKKKVTVAYGDGIGPAIMRATLEILDAAGANIEPEVIEIGKNVYLKGVSSGIEPSAWESLQRTKVFLKAPITTPQGGGYKSLNVTARTTLGLYANVRPCRSYHPFVKTFHPKTDMVIIRENEEDLYTGIEHRQTQEVYQTLKLVSRPGSEKIIHYAFEYARAFGRKKVTCFTKDNIMKMTDGLFHKVFDEIGEEYPEIQKDHKIVDIGSAILADTPETLDVVVTLNLYGDIISDIAAQITGSVGLGGSANIGPEVAMFEAIHGSAPDIAGKNIANPSGLLNAAIMMLVHIGETTVAEDIMNAWLRTLEDGIHTVDIYRADISMKKADTTQFAHAVIERLGKKPNIITPASFNESSAFAHRHVNIPSEKSEKTLVGVDVFLDWDQASRNPEILGEQVMKLAPDELSLKMISNRGVKVFPGGMPETFCSDHWRCRFEKNGLPKIHHADIIKLLEKLSNNGFDVIKTENLYTFNGEVGYSLGQGE